MAYAFTAASGQYLSSPLSTIAATPMTIACMCNARSANTLTQVSVGITSSTQRNQVVRLNTNNLRLSAQGTTLALADTTTTTPVGQWHHVAGVFTSSTSRTPYLEGIAGPTNTVNIGTQSAFSSLLIGARYAPSLGLYFNGEIAEVGIWNVALTAEEIASLAKGMTCDKIRPQNLVFYAPLVRDLVDKKGGLAITNNNTATVANHPRVYT